MATSRLIGAARVGILLIVITGPAFAESGRVTALSELEINERVEGDVVTLAGDVILGPDAEVTGHVVAIFGEVRRNPGARVEGRIIAVESLAGLQLIAGDEIDARLEWAVRLLTAGGWLLAATLVAFLFPGRIRFGVWLMPSVGMKVLVLGVLVYITLFAALVAFIGLGPRVGVPLVLALAIAFLLVRAFGLAVLGAAIGASLLRRVTDRPLPVTADVFCGLALILLLRFLPIVGGVLWTGMGLIAVGAAVFTFALAPQQGAVQAARSSTAPRQ
jgi:hypothetical protein